MAIPKLLCELLFSRQIEATQSSMLGAACLWPPSRRISDLVASTPTEEIQVALSLMPRLCVVNLTGRLVRCLDASTMYLNK